MVKLDMLGRRVPSVVLPFILLMTIAPDVSAYRTRPIDATEVIIKNGQYLHRAINNFNRVKIAPTLENVDVRISKVGQELLGSQSSQISNAYKNGFANYKKAKNELHTLQNKLKSLARETTQSVNTMLALLKTDNPLRQKEVFRQTTRKMLDLTRRSDQVLFNAEKSLKRINSHLSAVDASMVVLEHKLKSALSAKNKKKIKLPKSVAVCFSRFIIIALFNPELGKKGLSLCIYHLVGEIVLLIKPVEFLLENTKKLENEITRQQIEVRTWRSKLSQLNDMMESVDDAELLVDLDKDTVIQMFEDLKVACQDYIYDRTTKDFDGLV